MWDWDAEQRPPPAVLPGGRTMAAAMVMVGLLAAGAGLLLRHSGGAGLPSATASAMPLRAREPAGRALAIGEDLLLAGGGGAARVTVHGVKVGAWKCGAVTVDVTISGAAPIVPSAFTLTTADGDRVAGGAFCAERAGSVRIGFPASSVRLLSYTPYGGAALGSWRLG